MRKGYAVILGAVIGGAALGVFAGFGSWLYRDDLITIYGYALTGLIVGIIVGGGGVAARSWQSGGSYR